jgi:hypothetical protein
MDSQPLFLSSCSGCGGSLDVDNDHHVAGKDMCVGFLVMDVLLHARTVWILWAGRTVNI